MPKHRVKGGECITSIADHYGFYWITVWLHDANAELRRHCEDPNMLMEGDIVYVPDITAKKETGSTEQRHRFRKKGIPAVVRLQMFDGQEPRTNQKYRFTFGGGTIEGETDGEGFLEVPVPAELLTAQLIIGEDEAVYDINLGQLPPLSKLIGVQTRLNNLGYLTKKPSGELDDATRAALIALQFDTGLTADGELNEATRTKLAELHDLTSNFPPRSTGA